MEIGFDTIKNMTIAEVLELEKQYFFEKTYETPGYPKWIKAEKQNVLEENKE